MQKNAHPKGRDESFPVFFTNFTIGDRDFRKMNGLKRIARFYIDGFREMTLGRTLWAIILVKLFVLFAVLKLFFFPDPLAGKSTGERGALVGEALTEILQQSDR